MSELIESINRIGLIHPLVVTRDLQLVAGERRLIAVKKLGWERVPCQYVDEVDDFVLQCIEFEENIKRSDLEWPEINAAIKRYHDMRVQYDPTWTQQQTAEAIGITPQWVSERMKAAAEVERNPELKKIPRLSTVLGMIQRQASRKTDQQLHELRKMVSDDKQPSMIVNGDFHDFARDYVGPKFNFIHCDFPYGIEANKMQQGGSVATHGAYEDSAESYWALCSSLVDNLDRLCTESAHIMFWFSMQHYTDTISFFASRSDFLLDPFPLMWLKSDNIGLLPDPQRGPRRIYETCLYGARGDRKIVSAVSNAYAAPTDRSQHMSTKPEPVLRHFFRMFVDESSLVLDPTCGSGTALRAAESLGAAHILGVEINRDFTERANLEIQASRRMRI